MKNIIKPKMLEYIVGNKRICNKTKISALSSMFLLTESYSKIKIFWQNDTTNKQPSIITGIQFDDYIFIAAHLNSKKDRNTDELVQEILVDKNEPFFESMDIYEYTSIDLTDTNLKASSYITGLTISYKSKIYHFGHNFGELKSLLKVENIVELLKNNSEEIRNNKLISAILENNKITELFLERAKHPTLLENDDMIKSISPNHIHKIKITKINRPCLISGVGISILGILCLQIIEYLNSNKCLTDVSSLLFYERGNNGIENAKIISEFNYVDSNIDDNDSDNYLRAFSFLSSNYFEKEYYNKMIDSYYEGKIFMQNLVADYNFITYEESDPLILFESIYMDLFNNNQSELAIKRFYPMFIKLIDKAINDRNFRIIHSVLRLNRHLNYLIENTELPTFKCRDWKVGINSEQIEDYYKNNHKFFNKYILVKLKKIWNSLSEVMNLCQEINNSQLEINCYHVAFFSSNTVDYAYAIITSICQLCLLVLLGLSLLDINIAEIFLFLEAQITIPIIFIFTIMVVKKQMDNTLDFRRIFRHSSPPISFYDKTDKLGIINKYKHRIMTKLDYLSNVIYPIIVVILNFFVLAFSQDLLDIVLNSLAAIFIIELDDSVVFITEDDKQDLYKKYLINNLQSRLNKISPIYFDQKKWKYIHHYGPILCDAEYDPETHELVKKYPPSFDKQHIELIYRFNPENKYYYDPNNQDICYDLINKIYYNGNQGYDFKNGIHFEITNNQNEELTESFYIGPNNQPSKQMIFSTTSKLMRSIRRVRSLDSSEMTSPKRKSTFQKAASIELSQIEFEYK